MSLADRFRRSSNSKNNNLDGVGVNISQPSTGFDLAGSGASAVNGGLASDDSGVISPTVASSVPSVPTLNQASVQRLTSSILEEARRVGGIDIEALTSVINSVSSNPPSDDTTSGGSTTSGDSLTIPVSDNSSSDNDISNPPSDDTTSGDSTVYGDPLVTNDGNGIVINDGSISQADDTQADTTSNDSPEAIIIDDANVGEADLSAANTSDNSTTTDFSSPNPTYEGFPTGSDSPPIEDDSNDEVIATNNDSSSDNVGDASDSSVSQSSEDIGNDTTYEGFPTGSGYDVDSGLSDDGPVGTSDDSSSWDTSSPSYVGFPTGSSYDIAVAQQADANSDHPDEWGGSTEVTSSSSNAMTNNDIAVADQAVADSDHPENWN